MASSPASNFSGRLSCPLGIIRITAHDTTITSVLFVEHDEEESRKNSPLIDACAKQLRAYFGGSFAQFDLPIDPQGTAFQKRVWIALSSIAHGHTSSYGDLAKRLGDPKLTRAVGAANGSNPIAIIIPCHRIIGSDGSLTGYAGGLWRKQWLLQHESAQQALF